MDRPPTATVFSKPGLPGKAEFTQSVIQLINALPLCSWEHTLRCYGADAYGNFRPGGSHQVPSVCAWRLS